MAKIYGRGFAGKHFLVSCLKTLVQVLETDGHGFGSGGVWAFLALGHIPPTTGSWRKACTLFLIFILSLLGGKEGIQGGLLMNSAALCLHHPTAWYLAMSSNGTNYHDNQQWSFSIRGRDRGCWVPTMGRVHHHWMMGLYGAFVVSLFLDWVAVSWCLDTLMGLYK